MNGKVLCTVCGSDKTHYVSGESVSFRYETITNHGFGGVETITGTDSIRINKTLCLECGHVFEKANQDDLRIYKLRGKK